MKNKDSVKLKNGGERRKNAGGARKRRDELRKRDLNKSGWSKSDSKRRRCAFVSLS